jgi:hypothetical protein
MIIDLIIGASAHPLFDAAAGSAPHGNYGITCQPRQ